MLAPRSVLVTVACAEPNVTAVRPNAPIAAAEMSFFNICSSPSYQNDALTPLTTFSSLA